MAKDIFKRLSAGRPPPTEETIKQPPHRRENPKIFLKDILANGPVPATLVEERGAAHGFSRKQLWDAREKMKIVAFKEMGKPHGRWFCALPQHAGYPGTADEQPQKTP